MRRYHDPAPPLNVLLFGRQWDLVTPSLNALSDRGRFTFLGPVEEGDVEGFPSVVLVSPEPDVRLPEVKGGREGARSAPVLRCVHYEALEGEDLFEDVDDFVAVPCSAAELAKRLGRLARRTKALERPAGQRSLRVGEITLDAETYQVTVDGNPVPMAWMEFQLLRFLMENPGRVFRRNEILLRVWGTDYLGGARTVDVHMRRLRHKLGEQGERWLRTVRNVGYGLEDA